MLYRKREARGGHHRPPLDLVLCQWLGEEVLPAARQSNLGVGDGRLGLRRVNIDGQIRWDDREVCNTAQSAPTFTENVIARRGTYRRMSCQRGAVGVGDIIVRIPLAAWARAAAAFDRDGLWSTL